MKKLVLLLVFNTSNCLPFCNDINILYKYDLVVKLLNQYVDTASNTSRVLYISENNDSLFTINYFESRDTDFRILLNKKYDLFISSSFRTSIKAMTVYVVNSIECFLLNIPIQFCIENADRSISFIVPKNPNNQIIYSRNMEKIDTSKFTGSLSILQYPKYKSYEEFIIKK